jgi:hypothetical protein
VVAPLDLLGASKPRARSTGSKATSSSCSGIRRSAASPTRSSTSSASFLPEFKAFLDREGILDKSYFHLSDEPGGGQHVAKLQAGTPDPARPRAYG